MYILKIEMPNLAKGTAVQIDGLGIFKNGEESFISKEQAEEFRTRHVQLHTELHQDGVDVGIESAGTLLQHFKNSHGVKVRKASDTEIKENTAPVVDKVDEGPVSAQEAPSGAANTTGGES